MHVLVNVCFTKHPFYVRYFMYVKHALMNVRKACVTRFTRLPCVKRMFNMRFKKRMFYACCTFCCVSTDHTFHQFYDLDTDLDLHLCWDESPRTCHVFTRLFTLNTPWFFLDFAWNLVNQHICIATTLFNPGYAIFVEFYNNELVK